MIDFQEVAININLVDFLISKYNFKINKEKSSSRGFIVLQNANSTYLVKKQTAGKFIGEWFWLNADNFEDKGNIVQFVVKAENLNLKLKEDLFKLEEIITGQLVPNNFYESKSLNFDSSEKSFFNVVPLVDRKYLNSRGITDSTINSKLFKGKIFNKKAKAITGEFYLNTAFPYFDCLQRTGYTVVDNLKGEKIPTCTGLEIKGKDNKAATGTDKSKSLWLSNCEIDYNNVYVFESAIDALSFYQLNENDIFFSKALFVSTGGQITNGQINFILELAELKKLSLCFDRDVSGKFYSCNIIIRLLNQYGYQTELVKSGKYHANLTILSSLLDRSLLNSISGSVKGGLLKTIEFKLDYETMTFVEKELLVLLKEIDSVLEIEIFEARNKDFNEDLN